MERGDIITGESNVVLGELSICFVHPPQRTAGFLFATNYTTV